MVGQYSVMRVDAEIIWHIPALDRLTEQVDFNEISAQGKEEVPVRQLFNFECVWNRGAVPNHIPSVIDNGEKRPAAIIVHDPKQSIAGFHAIGIVH